MRIALFAIAIGPAGNSNKIMENEEQTTQEPSPVKPGSSSTRMAVMGILLIAMVAMALIQSSAKRGRDNAVAKADEMEGFATPAEYVKAIGKTPRIDIKDGGVTQVYRWKGVLQHFELRVNFLGSDGVYTASGTESSSISVFKGGAYNKLKFATKTGTQFEKFEEVKSPKDGEIDEQDGPGAGKTPSGPRPGDGPGAPGMPGSKGNQSGQSRSSAYFADLGLDDDQKAKVDAIIEKMSAEIQELRSGPREGMREKFTALRTKYDAQFKEVLTEEQFENYKKAREAARGQWGGGKGKGKGRPPERP